MLMAAKAPAATLLSVFQEMKKTMSIKERVLSHPSHYRMERNPMTMAAPKSLRVSWVKMLSISLNRRLSSLCRQADRQRRIRRKNTSTTVYVGTFKSWAKLANLMKHHQRPRSDPTHARSGSTQIRSRGSLGQLGWLGFKMSALKASSTTWRYIHRS